MKRYQRGSAHIIILLIALVVAVGGFASWKVIGAQKNANASSKDADTQSSTASKSQKTYTDTAGKFSLSYPSDWTAANQEVGGGDGGTQTESDWTAISRPIVFKPASGQPDNDVTVTPGCETTDNSGGTIPVLEYLKMRKDQFHTQQDVTINSYAGFYDRLDFKGDAESYTDHNYFVTNGSDCLFFSFREKWNHDMSGTDFDDSKNVPAYKAIVNSVKFLGKSPITVEGVVGCLEPKDKSGPSIMSCAIGLKQDDGTSYALGSDDPMMTGSIPTGQKVKVTGTFTEQSSTYDSKGLIHVTAVEQL